MPNAPPHSHPRHHRSQLNRRLQRIGRQSHTISRLLTSQHVTTVLSHHRSIPKRIQLTSNRRSHNHTRKLTLRRSTNIHITISSRQCPPRRIATIRPSRTHVTTFTRPITTRHQGRRNRPRANRAVHMLHRVLQLPQVPITTCHVRIKLHANTVKVRRPTVGLSTILHQSSRQLLKLIRPVHHLSLFNHIRPKTLIHSFTIVPTKSRRQILHLYVRHVQRRRVHRPMDNTNCRKNHSSTSRCCP